MITWQITFEFIATISGLACVYLQTEEKIEAWIFGIISVTLAAFIYYDERLFSDLLLHVIFLILNIYGWWNWLRVKKARQMSYPTNLETPETEASILSFTKKDWVTWILVIVAVTPLLGYLMNNYLGAEMAYPDAFTTTASLVAQYLLAKKYLENWLIWIAVDVVAMTMYYYKGLYLFSFLFAAYLALSIKGYLDWKKQVALNQSISP